MYKGKGDTNDPSNYRGITLLSCIGKIFTSLISKRIHKYVEDFQLLGEEQAGFRPNHSTIDHIFVLYALINIYTKKTKKKLYCTFIDYAKAFDTVPRMHLWSKLLGTQINGKVLNVIKKMYDSAKSYIRHNNTSSGTFRCELGVRQGEHLSPLLFALYLNDLENFLSKAYNGLQLTCDLIQEFNQTDDLVTYLKLFVILYADDTVVLAEDAQELQAALNGMYHYCQLWKLHINISKTKTIVFGSRKSTKNVNKPTFRLGDKEIDMVDDYTYLGVLFRKNGSMTPGIKKLKDQASRAMYSLLGKSRKLGLDIDIQVQLFDCLIIPIVTYGSEVWGCQNFNIIEQLHLQFCKTILRVNRSTTNCMVYGELGRVPLSYNVEIKMLNFWYRLAWSEHNNKLSCIMYRVLYNMDSKLVYHCEWIKKIKEILTKSNLYDMLWNQQGSNTYTYVAFKNIAKKNLKAYYADQWRENVENSSKCFFYKEYKTELAMEKYLMSLNYNSRTYLTKLRVSNHKLPIELGRHQDVAKIDRICTFCNKYDIGDEYHYMFICKKFDDIRNKQLPKNCLKCPSVQKYCDLMKSNNNKLLQKLSSMAKLIIKSFEN